MPPPGAAGPFLPNFMPPGMQPSMIIRKLYLILLIAKIMFPQYF